MPNNNTWSCPLCGKESNKWPEPIPQRGGVEAECRNCWEKATNPPSKPQVCRFQFDSAELLRAESDHWKRKFIDLCLAWKPGQALPRHPVE